METTSIAYTDTINIFATDHPYYPLVFSVDGCWSCKFQLKPDIRVIVSGEKPSELDFIRAMQHTNASICLIQALYVAVCVAFDSNK